MKENWANRLKERMIGYEPPVDDALWAGIAQATVTKGNRWWLWVSAAVASAAAVIAVVLISRPETVTEPLTASPVEGELPSLRADNPVLLANGLSVHPRTKIITPSRQEESFIEEEEEIEDGILPIPETIAQIENIVAEESAYEEGPIESDYDGWETILSEESLPRQPRIKLSTSLYAQASPFGSHHFQGLSPGKDGQPWSPPGTPSSPHEYPEGGTDPGGQGGGQGGQEGDNTDDPEETKALGRSMTRAQSEPTSVSSQWTHAFPVQIGARVSLSWSERWSIETGLSFIHFTSWNADGQQRMDFLGVPVFVDFMIGNSHNFSFYASAGGQALKCFAGNAPDKPWLFSCGFGAGADYSISPLISIYAEPGVDWYFHTGESRHYYTDNPFAISFSLGIRLHF